MQWQDRLNPFGLSVAGGEYYIENGSSIGIKR